MKKIHPATCWLIYLAIVLTACAEREASQILEPKAVSAEDVQKAAEEAAEAARQVAVDEAMQLRYLPLQVHTNSDSGTDYRRIYDPQTKVACYFQGLQVEPVGCLVVEIFDEAVVQEKRTTHTFYR